MKPATARVLMWVSLPLFNVLNQVAMKMTASYVAAESFGLAWFRQALLCPYLWMSFSCEIINFGLWLSILKHHNLAQAFPLTALSYAALMVTSWTLFNEPLQLQHALGAVIILGGILVMGFETKKA